MHQPPIKPAVVDNMRLIFIIQILLIYSSVIFSQISEGGTPPSFHHQLNLRSEFLTTDVSVDFFVEDLRETDSWQAGNGTPMPVAKLISVNYTMDNSGNHTVLSNGEQIWSLQLKAKGAIALMLYYADFYIPEGGRLYIYNVDKTQVIGAYTHRTHPSGGRFATEFVGGDELILEYVASTSSDEKPRIAINEIGYGYNTSALRTFIDVTTYATAGSCEVNVNCEEGIAWQNEIKGVYHSVQKIGEKSFICSGSLVNNTARDFKPLVLTAMHCASDGDIVASAADMEQWLFYFHQEREGCSNYSHGNPGKTMTGCTLLASTGMEGGSDGMLLLLKDTIPDDYNVFYNGWDWSGGPAHSGVNIHHPQGDYKKISTYNETTTTQTFRASDFTGDDNGHWNVIFKATSNGHGVTEGGSSGSPLFDENKLIVGTLSGGSSSCRNPRGLNLFGKFSYHWNKYTTDETTRMDVWLDPLNTSAKTLSGCYRSHSKSKPSPVNLSAVYLGQNVLLSWLEPEGDEKPIYYNIYRNNTKIDIATSLSFTDTDIIYGSIVYSVSAVYEDDEESTFATMALVIIKHKAPYDLKVIADSDHSGHVTLSWTAPLYEQTITWGTLTPVYMIGFKEIFPFYFGQKWDADEIAPLHCKTITAVRFFPVRENTYEIFITQGARAYRQPIDNSSLRPQRLNTIELDIPYVIDGSSSLIVSILASNLGSPYPAACDDGPFVDGKGNIWARYTDDGELEWEVLYEDTPGEFEYNFIVAAIVSSENGDLPNQPNRMVISNSNTVKKPTDQLLVRKMEISSIEDEVSLRNSYPAAFPEITHYRIYKSGSVYMNAFPPATTYIDKYFTKNDYYEISAFYDHVETEKTPKTYISIVDNNLPTLSSMRISPTAFTNTVLLQGIEIISRVEVISLTGKISLVVDRPDRQIDTSSLTPGIYFFRILDVNHNQQVIKAVKTK